LILSPLYERKTFAAIFNEVNTLLSKKGKFIMIDVGAHVGKYTISIGKAFKPIMIISIEPHPINMEMLSKAVKANDLNNIICIKAACADTNGYTKLWVSNKSDCHSLTKPLQSHKSIKVLKRSIDSLVSELNLTRVDLIKIDVEGAEYEVVKGAFKTIKKYRPLIFAEISPENYQKVSCLLNTVGYKILKLESNNFVAKPENHHFLTRYACSYAPGY